MRLRHWLAQRREDPRLRKNIKCSVAGFCISYSGFLLLIWWAGVGNHDAKIYQTAWGIPLGVLIQWLVFGDRVMKMKTRLSWAWLIALLTSRYLLVKVSFWLVNICAYGLLLHAAGFPNWAANALPAPFVSLAFYTAMALWVTKNRPESQAATA